MSEPVASARRLMPPAAADPPHTMTSTTLQALKRLVGGGDLTIIYQSDGITIHAAWFITAPTAYLYSRSNGLNTQLCPMRRAHVRKISNWIANHSFGWELKGRLLETEWHRARGVKADHQYVPNTVCEPPTPTNDSCGGIL